MNHKYGFHVNRTGDDVLDAIKRIKPAMVKTLDPNVGFWTQVRAVHPDVFLIGRLVMDLHAQERFADNPTASGRAFAERILRHEAAKTTFQGKPLFDAWESYNEVFPGSASSDLKRQYDDFQVAFGEPIKAAGFEPIGMNFATGNMLGRDFLDFFRGTLETYTYLGFHEYDWPQLWRLHEENIREKNEGGMWLTLRYRRTMTEVRKVFPDKHKVIITECGMTQAVAGHDDIGWRADPAVSEDDYWKSLMWYNDELMKDRYVDSALLFVVGATGGWPKWESFEHLGGIVNRLEALQRSAPLKPIKPVEPESAQAAHPSSSAVRGSSQAPGDPVQPQCRFAAAHLRRGLCAQFTGVRGGAQRHTLRRPTRRAPGHGRSSNLFRQDRRLGQCRLRGARGRPRLGSRLKGLLT